MLSRLILLLLSAALAVVHAAYQYPNPGACTGNCSDAHDPSIVRRSSDGKLFRFTTRGLIQIHTAFNMTGPWRFECTMLERDSKVKVPGNDGDRLWAPDVSKVGDEYYVYYTVSTNGSQSSSIGLATSKTMDCGSFEDHGRIGIESDSSKPFNALDPNLLNDNGTYRMNFGSFWHDIYQVEMRDPPLRIAPRALGPQARFHNIAYEPSTERQHPEEGSFMVKCDRHYYLFYSKGQCCNYDENRPPPGFEYRVKVCRSTKPNRDFVRLPVPHFILTRSQLTGPQVDRNGTSCLEGGGTTVLASHGEVLGPGGQSVYKDPQIGWVMVYQYTNTSIGLGDWEKQFGWNRLRFEDGWPVVIA